MFTATKQKGSITMEDKIVIDKFRKDNDLSTENYSF